LAVKYFDLIDYYKTNFNLFKQLNLSIADLDNMMFWERELYVKLLIDFNEEQEQLRREKEINNQWQ
jgi:hypothetical protein